MFAVGTEPKNYNIFRNSWILRRRMYPVVPCPENTPLLHRKTSKQIRSKRALVYLTPWTLSSRLATSTVPTLWKLGFTSQMTEKTSQNGLRHAWKKYIAATLPHASIQIHNFLLNCLSEGIRIPITIVTSCVFKSFALIYLRNFQSHPSPQSSTLIKTLYPI